MLAECAAASFGGLLLFLFHHIEEIGLRLDEVARMEHERLGLGENVEKQSAGLGACCGGGLQQLDVLFDDFQ